MIKIIKLISDSISNNLVNDLTINDLYTNYIDFINTLDVIQLGALCYTLLSITLIYIFINILLAVIILYSILK